MRRSNGAAITSSDLRVFSASGHHITEVIGKGSFSSVYLDQCIYKVNGVEETKNLAVKVIDTRLVPKTYAKKFLPREFKVLSVIKHPYIIYTYKILVDNLKYYVFMQYAEKGQVLEYVLANGEQTEDVARVWMHQLAHALHYLHLQGIVHRDIKCDNILLTQSMSAKFSDFGFTRTCQDLHGGLSETFCGSLNYAAPEIIQGQPYNPKLSDVWSLGCVLFFILNKKMPFEYLNKRMLYQCAMKRRYAYNMRVEQRLSIQSKRLISSMMNPKTTKGERFTIEQVLESEWLKMESRLEKERIALQQVSLIKQRGATTDAFDEALEKKMKKLTAYELDRIISSIK